MSATLGQIINKVVVYPTHADGRVNTISYSDAKKVARLLRSKIAATSQVTDRVKSRDVRAMSQYELVPIHTLCCSIYRTRRIPVGSMERITAVYFGVRHITDIPKRKYNEVIRFLVDLRCAKNLLRD